jgi:hypothetical protein
MKAIYRDCHVSTVRTGQNEAKNVTFRLSGRASRAIYATNEAIDTLGHTLTAHKALFKLVTGEAKGHAPRGSKLRSKKYSTHIIKGCQAEAALAISSTQWILTILSFCATCNM